MNEKIDYRIVLVFAFVFVCLFVIGSVLQVVDLVGCGAVWCIDGVGGLMGFPLE